MSGDHLQIEDWLQKAAGPRGIPPDPSAKSFWQGVQEAFGQLAVGLLLAAIAGGVWYYLDQDRQHEVKVCAMELGLGQTIYDPGVSQHCKDVLAEEAVRREEAGKR